MPRAARFGACAIIICAIGAAYVFEALGAPPNPKDDPLWVNRSANWPIRIHDGMEQFYQIDLASANRWIYHAVMELYGVHPSRVLEADYGRSMTWNRAHKRFAPTMIQEMLRLANVGLFLGGVALLGALAWWLLRSAPLALVTVAPLLLSPTFATMVAYRIGPDAVLFFSLCMMTAFWTALDLKGKATGRGAVIVLGLLAGFATGCKVNGALILIAYCAFLVARSRGLDRLANPIVACVAAAVAFCLINPVVFVYGPSDYIVAVVRRRMELLGSMNGESGPLAFTRLLWYSFPMWPLLVVAAAAVWNRVPRAMRWSSVFLVAGTLATINRDKTEYLAPIELGACYTLAFGVAALFKARREAKAHIHPAA